MRFAAIDVGTNSIHLIVVEIDAGLDTSRVLYKDREMVRLGAGDAMERGHLGPKAMERGADAIARFAQAARERGAVALRAVATSAVREASNAQVFAKLVRERADVQLEILSGHEEARLIHLGVARGYPIYDRLACIVDIGGGSTEFIVADGYRSYLLESVKLGSLRLYDAYLRGVSSHIVASYRLEQHIQTQLAPVMERLREFPLDLVLGTSGTIMGLAALDAARDQVAARVHGYELRLEHLRALQMRMLPMSEAERRRMPGMNPRRADIIVAGNAIAIAVLEGLRRDGLVVCERALRDGVVVDYVQRDHELMRSLGDEQARRRDAIESLGRRFAGAGAHERQVATLAASLFDRLLDLHGMGEADRQILNAAALLHDIGCYINPSAHHKHGAYIIRSAILEGWSPEETQVLAAVVRYHRKALPKPTHFEMSVLGPPERARAIGLAAILRIADGLDTRRLGLVRGIDVHREGRDLEIVVQADEDVARELTSALFKSDLFEDFFALRVHLRAARIRERA